MALLVGHGLIEIGWHRPAEIAAGFLPAFVYACRLLALLAGYRPEAFAAPAEPGPAAAMMARLVQLGVAVAALVRALLAFGGTIGDGELDRWLVLVAAEITLVLLAIGLPSQLLLWARRAGEPTHR